MKYKVGDRLFQAIQNTIIDDDDIKVLVREHEVVRVGKTYSLDPPINLSKARYSESDLAALSATKEEAVARLVKRLENRRDAARRTADAADRYLAEIAEGKAHYVSLDDVRGRREEVRNKRLAEDSHPND